MSKSNNKFTLSVCGGTFDLFHKGHREFLISVFANSQKAFIGVTSDNFSPSKKTFEKFSERNKSVLDFIKSNDFTGEVVEIDNIYGPTLDKLIDFEAIFVTSDSLGGAEKINKTRVEKGLKKLEIIKVDLEKDSTGNVISSSRIRKGEIDRDGNLYIDENLLSSDFYLPEILRSTLSKPFGEIKMNFYEYLLKENIDPKKIISVGDVVTSTFLEKNIIPKLSIVDLAVNRRKKFDNIHELGFKNTACEKVDNPAGHVSKDLIKKVKESMNMKNLVIQINGEEDLAVIPAVLAAPLGYEIFYGQPGEGVVRIEVSGENKKEIKDLISRFRRKVI